MKFLQRKTPLFWWRLFFALAAASFSLLIILQPSPWQVLAAAGSVDNFGLTQTIYFWTWWGGLGSILITVGLFVLAPWWAGAPAAESLAGPSAPKSPRWFWPLVVGAVLACSAISGPLLGQSLVDDENESLSFYSLGRYVREGDQGRIRFKAYPWRRTVFGYSTPNNHVFHNVLSRASNTLWRSVTQPRGLQFNHVAIRLPAFLAALAAVAALALLLKQTGYPGAGVLAAWFLALHPWFTEHAAMARGYTLLMLLTVLAVSAWRLSLQTGRWAWWLSFSAAQFLALWTYPASVFLFAPLNVATALLIWRRPRGVAGPARSQLSRWFCVNSMVAAGLLPLLLPLLPQIKQYIATQTAIPHELGFAWIRDVLWFFTGGAPWMRGSSSADWRYLDMQLVTESLGKTGLCTLGIIVAIPVVAGIWRLARTGWTGAALALCAIVAPCLKFLYAKNQQVFIWEWYVIFALPFVAMFWGLGTASLAGLLARIPPRLPWMTPLAGTAFVLLYAFTTQPVRAWKAVHAKTQHRESTLLTRSNPGDYRSPENRRVLTFGIANASIAYDPNLILLRTPAELVLLCRQADRENRPLYANIGQIHVMEGDHARELALLRDPRLFGTSTKLGGADRGLDRFVFVYTPGSASKYDFSAVLTPEELAYVEANVNRRPESVFSKKKLD